MNEVGQRKRRASQAALEVVLGRISRPVMPEVLAHLPPHLGTFSAAALPTGNRFGPYDEVVDSIASRGEVTFAEAEVQLQATVRILADCLPKSVLMHTCAELKSILNPVLRPDPASPCGDPPSPLRQVSPLPLATAPPIGRGLEYVALRQRRGFHDWH